MNEEAYVEEPSNKQSSVSKQTNTEEDSHPQKYPKKRNGTSLTTWRTM